MAAAVKQANVNSARPDRTHPAHHAPAELHHSPVIVQVNVCTKDRVPLLACDAGHQLCRGIWQQADYWRVGQYLIMPDHIHLFCAPGRVPPTSLRQWVKFWKSRIAAQWPGGTGSACPEARVRSVADETPRGRGTMDVGPPARRVPDDTPKPRGAAEVVPPENGTGGTTSVFSVSGVVAPVKLWQRDFWDTQMRSREHYEEKLSYVRMNPVRKGLVTTPEAWPYQGEVFPIAWI